jgi:hypothetical protein
MESIQGVPSEGIYGFDFFGRARFHRAIRQPNENTQNNA